MKITFSYSEVNSILIAWVKAHITDLPSNAEFDVSSNSYSGSTITVTEPEPASQPTEEQKIA